MYAVVPVKAFHLGKQRLAECLDHAQRAALCEAMCRDVLGVLKASKQFSRCFLLGNDASLSPLARDLGVELVLESELAVQGLNDSLQALCRRQLDQQDQQEACFIAHSDLPLLQLEEIKSIAAQLGTHKTVLVADRHGSGTNILAGQWPADTPFSFGVNSLEKHATQLRRQAREPAILQLEGASWDIDRAEDVFDAAAQQPEKLGFYTATCLGRMGLLNPMMSERAYSSAVHAEPLALGS